MRIIVCKIIQMDIYGQILKNKKKNKKSLAILLDPDYVKKNEIRNLAQKIIHTGADYIFLGGSIVQQNKIDKIIKRFKKYTDLPIILFPGDPQQISGYADGILFLSLISGRNPDYLIGHQVIAAPFLAQTNLEVISTGYILIENGHTTAVEYVSQTKPIPRNKPQIALATALAGEMLGMKLIYLEAGSGAKEPVPKRTIRAISKNLQIPVIVGGGIRTRKQMEIAFEKGADIVVVGTAFEDNSFL